MSLGGHSEAHQTWLWLIVTGLFAAALVAGALLYRRAGRTAELEEIDRLLDE
jgi:hypothetical protein